MRTHFFRTFAILGLTAFLLIQGSPAATVAAGVEDPAATEEAFLPGQLLVRFKAGVTQQRRADVRS